MPVTSKSKRAQTKDAGISEKFVVTSQQSRFHVDANDAPTSKDVDIRDLTITIGDREIVDHVKLSLKEGGRYALIGRNGLGKSTILRALAERRIPGVALNLRILLLGQTRAGTDEVEGPDVHMSDQSVLRHVITSDKQRERIAQEAQSLSQVLEKKTESFDEIVSTTRLLKLNQARRELDVARLIAERRSGARGSQARKVLIEKEKALEVAEEIYAAPSTAADAQTEIDAAIQMLDDLQLSLDGMDASTTESRARSILFGLGFSDEQIDGRMSALSGGWQTRASLAASLVQQTDMLLLDEPTNFLDLPAVIWLQQYLTSTLSSSTTLVVTTHDRDFADAVADHLIILRLEPPKSLEVFKGILSDYTAEKHRQIRRMTKMSAALEHKKKHMESTVAKSISAAKRTGDDKKLKQAASRKKKLEERTGLEVSATGNRFKLNRDMQGYFTKMRADIEIPDFDPPVNIAILEEPPLLRNVGTLASIENVSFTYPGTKKQILDNVTLVIHPGSRTGIVGLNGSGKSTLFNLLLSTTHKPSKGTITLHSQARIAHYTQHHPTTLQSLPPLTPSSPSFTILQQQQRQDQPHHTPLTYLSSLHPELPEQTLRATLSGLSLHPTHQTTPLPSLSGGQLVRVALATCLLPYPPHLLILDEPTTHLDTDTTVALITALKSFSGAIIAISHDRFFIRCVVEGDSPRFYGGDRGVLDPDSLDDNENSDHDGESDDDASEKRGTVYRMTKSGKLLKLDGDDGGGGMSQYEDLIVRQLSKKGIEIG